MIAGLNAKRYVQSVQSSAVYEAPLTIYMMSIEYYQG